MTSNKRLYVAEQQSIFIMRAFREMRHYIKRISSLQHMLKCVL